eukprot:jgi/Picre1/33525/NNA_008848.t2
MQADTVSRQDSPSKGSNVKDSNNDSKYTIRLHYNSRKVDFRENGIDIFVDVMYNWMCDQASGLKSSSNPNNVSNYMTSPLKHHLSTMFPEYTDIIEKSISTKRSTQYTTSNRVRKKMKTSGSTTPPSSDMQSAKLYNNTSKILETNYREAGIAFVVTAI